MDAEITIDALKNSPSTLPYGDPDYRAPTREELQTLREFAELSQRKIAIITGVRYTEDGSPLVRRWFLDTNSQNYRPIPYSAWRLLLEYAGIVSTQDTQAFIKNLTRK